MLLLVHQYNRKTKQEESKQSYLSFIEIFHSNTINNSSKASGSVGLKKIAIKGKAI